MRDGLGFFDCEIVAEYALSLDFSNPKVIESPEAFHIIAENLDAYHEMYTDIDKKFSSIKKKKQIDESHSIFELTLTKHDIIHNPLIFDLFHGFLHGYFGLLLPGVIVEICQTKREVTASQDRCNFDFEMSFLN